VRVPDVPVTVTVLVPLGVPPVGVWPPPQPANARKPTIAAAVLRQMANLCLRAKKSSSENAKNKGTVRHRSMRVSGVEDGGATIDGLVVARVTMAETGVTPSVVVTDVGAMVHVELAGKPVQARAMAWLKPPVGVTVTLKVPLMP
jgi:hypothetical protein